MSIELDYRIGIKSLHQISGECGVTEGAIRKRAKRDHWTRDLSEMIKMKADFLVRKDAVRSVVRSKQNKNVTAYREPFERDIIASNDRLNTSGFPCCIGAAEQWEASF